MSDEKLPTVKFEDLEIPITPINKKRRSSRGLQEIAEEAGVNPFEILLHAAAGDWEALGYTHPTRIITTKGGGSYEEDILTPEIRIGAAKEAAQYLYPKLRSVEVSGDSEKDPIGFEFKGSILDLVKLARG